MVVIDLVEKVEEVVVEESNYKILMLVEGVVLDGWNYCCR